MTRGLIAILSRIKQNTSMKVEFNRNKKLTTGMELLDNYLSNILRGDNTKCEIPRIDIQPYYQVSNASIFVIDKSVISDFKHLIKQIDWFSESFILSQRSKDLSDQKALSFLCPTTLGIITSNFGIRTDPVFEGTEKHCGVDIAGKLWSPITSTADGTVSFASWSNRYGNLIILNHSNGIQTVYAHLQKISVNKNDKVKAGQMIGYLGSTGKSTGAHLHYEIRVHGKSVDPIPYLIPSNEISD
jgi:murein DD-endopeptidase MepM/ murein hydrolase activator NlpD